MYCQFIEIIASNDPRLGIIGSCVRHHLREMILFRDVLHKRKEKNRHTSYSLTKKFKDELDKQKRKYPTTFAKKTLSLLEFTRSTSFPREYGIPADEGD